MGYLLQKSWCSSNPGFHWEIFEAWYEVKLLAIDSIKLPKMMPEVMPEMVPEMLPEVMPEMLPEMVSEMLPEMVLTSISRRGNSFISRRENLAYIGILENKKCKNFNHKKLTFWGLRRPRYEYCCLVRFFCSCYCVCVNIILIVKNLSFFSILHNLIWKHSSQFCCCTYSCLHFFCFYVWKESLIVIPFLSEGKQEQAVSRT